MNGTVVFSGHLVPLLYFGLTQIRIFYYVHPPQTKVGEKLLRIIYFLSYYIDFPHFDLDSTSVLPSY